MKEGGFPIKYNADKSVAIKSNPCEVSNNICSISITVMYRFVSSMERNLYWLRPFVVISHSSKPTKLIPEVTSFSGMLSSHPLLIYLIIFIEILLVTSTPQWPLLERFALQRYYHPSRHFVEMILG